MKAPHTTTWAVARVLALCRSQVSLTLNETVAPPSRRRLWRVCSARARVFEFLSVCVCTRIRGPLSISFARAAKTKREIERDSVQSRERARFEGHEGPEGHATARFRAALSPSVEVHGLHAHQHAKHAEIRIGCTRESVCELPAKLTQAHTHTLTEHSHSLLYIPERARTHAFWRTASPSPSSSTPHIIQQPAGVHTVQFRFRFPTLQYGASCGRDRFGNVRYHHSSPIIAAKRIYSRAKPARHTLDTPHTIRIYAPIAAAAVVAVVPSFKHRTERASGRATAGLSYTRAVAPSPRSICRHIVHGTNNHTVFTSCTLTVAVLARLDLDRPTE